MDETTERDDDRDDETLPVPPGEGGDSIPTLGGGAGGGGRRSDGPADGLERPGDEIGPYKLISWLGAGGFGTVWLAERREDFTQRVAIKVIKAGMDSKKVLARFEQERQALAVMNHPGIANVFDGGLTPKGRPYFAMEYVKGEPVTQFCDTRKLTLHERLEVFAQVCEAVQHAHLKGIVHRDLTPWNILAFEREGEGPKVKVIDFGLAKAMSQPLTEKTIFTQMGRPIGTRGYMSPEQADPTNADIDTRSDIYSLGVLLYELIVGATPFDSQDLKGDLQRILREVDPPRPSDRLSTISTKDREAAARIEQSRGVRLADLTRTLRSELEWIPLKAMRKEPRHRYQTAMSLAEDVRNYLDGKPLIAGPESTSYRVGKYVRRHKTLVTSAAAVVMALVVGLSVAAWQWRVAVAREETIKGLFDSLLEAEQQLLEAVTEIPMEQVGEEAYRDVLAYKAQLLETAIDLSTRADRGSDSGAELENLAWAEETLGDLYWNPDGSHLERIDESLACRRQAVVHRQQLLEIQPDQSAKHKLAVTSLALADAIWRLVEGNEASLDTPPALREALALCGDVDRYLSPVEVETPDLRRKLDRVESGLRREGAIEDPSDVP